MIGDEFPDLADGVDDGLEERCYPSASDILVFRYRDDPPAYAIKARFAGISELLKELRAPDDANRIYCVKFSGVEEVLKTGDLPPRFKNYSVERVGLNIGTLTRLAGGGKLKPFIRDSKLFISQPSYWHERPNFLIQVWRTRVFACPVTQLQTDLSHPLSFIRPLSMYLEERWYPTRGKDRYLHWAVHHQRNNSRIEQFRRDAVQILEGGGKLGRPKGTKIHNSREEFIREYGAAYSKSAQGGEGEPSQVSVASVMEISVSTLQRRLREFSITWPPISSRTGV
jgi:hypothetical protein